MEDDTDVFERWYWSTLLVKDLYTTYVTIQLKVYPSTSSDVVYKSILVPYHGVIRDSLGKTGIFTSE